LPVSPDSIGPSRFTSSGKQADRTTGAAFFVSSMSKSTPPNRAATAAKIAENPTGYKVCEGCDSIVGSAAAICPNCHSYRFESSAERVVQQARILGAREQTSVTSSDLS
jgi:hypothetical protein